MVETPAPADPARITLAFAVCTLTWGSTFLFIRIGNDTVPPMWGATLRLVLAAVILVALAYATRQGLPTGAARRAAAAYGFFQFGLNMPLLYWGETAVPSGLAAVVFATVPISSSIIARAFGLERFERGKIVAALVALGGVAVLFAHDLSARVTALPLLSIFLATVAAPFGSVFLKRGPLQSPIGANAIGSIVGAPMCLLVSFLAGESHALPTRAAQVVPIVYLTVAGSVVAFVVFSWLVQRVDVSTVAFIGVIVPVIAITLGVWVRHERLAREHFVGSLLVLTGVALAIANDRRRMARAAVVASSVAS